jgi:hypothetical protein
MSPRIWIPALIRGSPNASGYASDPQKGTGGWSWKATKAIARPDQVSLTDASDGSANSTEFDAEPENSSY